MRWALGALVGLSLSTACYAPKVLGGAPCDPENADSCPTGQTCETRSNGSFCSGDSTTDGGTSDAPPGSFCLGANLLGSVCLDSAPNVATKLIGSTTVNTSSTNPGNCTQILSQPGGPSLCVITGDSVEIAAGVTLRAVGPNPLVLFGAHTVTVAGTIDVSSRVGETTILGAGARQATDCNTLGINGLPSDNGNNGANAGGGGAGGTYGGTGGNGGAGKGNIKGGVPVASSSLNVLIGGCPGGKGGDGSDGGGFGLGGNGGGAVYLIAGDMVTVTGVVNASGAGGGPGVNGGSSSGGGGGGGAGGMIGAEAPHLMLGGSVFANGGGGGAGGGNQPNDHGLPGTDPVAALTPAPGGKGTNGGADGGTGSGVALVGGAGKSVGGNTTNQCAGGGGGGGGGIIRLFGDPAPTLGMISPPRT